MQLETQTGGAITMDLAYQVHNARWRPSYDIRVETGEKKRMTITYFGHVAQGTGEEWTNVQMVDLKKLIIELVRNILSLL